MFKPSRPFPPRPRNVEFCVPSLDWTLQAIVAVIGAKNALPPQLRNRLAMCGIPWEEMEPLLTGVRTVEGWARAWMRAAEVAEAEGNFAKAAAMAFLGQLVVSPRHPAKGWFLSTLQRNHLRDRQAMTDRTVERVELAGGQLVGIWEVPHGADRMPVMLMPPLASTKEELTVFADPLLAQGHPVLRLDMPGQGESPAPLSPTLETILQGALDEMGFTAAEGVILGGISLGSYFSLRLAAVEPRRVRAVFGVSPPAIVTPADWARQLEIIWQYLDIYFGCETREQTHRLALTLHLDPLGTQVRCPVLLYHGTQDRICVPDARERYREILPCAPLTDYLLPDVHACPMHLSPRIAPEVVRWLKQVIGS